MSLQQIDKTTGLPLDGGSPTQHSTEASAPDAAGDDQVTTTQGDTQPDDLTSESGQELNSTDDLDQEDDVASDEALDESTAGVLDSESDASDNYQSDFNQLDQQTSPGAADEENLIEEFNFSPRTLKRLDYERRRGYHYLDRPRCPKIFAEGEIINLIRWTEDWENLSPEVYTQKFNAREPRTKRSPPILKRRGSLVGREVTPLDVILEEPENTPPQSIQGAGELEAPQDIEPPQDCESAQSITFTQDNTSPLDSPLVFQDDWGLDEDDWKAPTEIEWKPVVKKDTPVDSDTESPEDAANSTEDLEAMPTVRDSATEEANRTPDAHTDEVEAEGSVYQNDSPPASPSSETASGADEEHSTPAEHDESTQNNAEADDDSVHRSGLVKKSSFEELVAITGMEPSEAEEAEFERKRRMKSFRPSDEAPEGSETPFGADDEHSSPTEHNSSAPNKATENDDTVGRPSNTRKTSLEKLEETTGMDLFEAQEADRERELRIASYKTADEAAESLQKQRSSMQWELEVEAEKTGYELKKTLPEDPRERFELSRILAHKYYSQYNATYAICMENRKYYADQIALGEQTLEEVEQEKQKLKSELEAKTKELEEDAEDAEYVQEGLRKRIEELTKELKQATKSVADLTSTRSNLQSLEEKHEALLEANKALNDQIARLTSQIEELDQARITCEQSLQGNKKRTDQLQEEISEYEATLRETHTSHDESIVEKDNKIAQLELALAELKASRTSETVLNQTQDNQSKATEETAKSTSRRPEHLKIQIPSQKDVSTMYDNLPTTAMAPPRPTPMFQKSLFVTPASACRYTSERAPGWFARGQQYRNTRAYNTTRAALREEREQQRERDLERDELRKKAIEKLMGRPLKVVPEAERLELYSKIGGAKSRRGVEA